MERNKKLVEQLQVHKETIAYLTQQGSWLGRPAVLCCFEVWNVLVPRQRSEGSRPYI